MGIFDIFKKKNDDVKIKIEVTTSSTPTTDSYDVLPIEKRIKNQKPTCDGLFPHEVLVLSYAPKYYTEDNEFPRFWWTRYGIKDVMKVLRSLQKQGLIRIGSINEAIEASKLPDIKVVLQKYDLKVTGKKTELVNRLVDNVSEDELSKLFPKRPFTLTDAGASILNKYPWIAYIHSHGADDLDIWSLTALVQANSSSNYRDAIWGYFNKKLQEYGKYNRWGFSRNIYLQMSDFLLEEGKIDQAFRTLCSVMALDFSGLCNGFSIDSLYIVSAD